MPESVDIAVIGAGAAGLMTAITAGRIREKRPASSGPSIVLLDSRAKIGAKILISGGTRCNVTNRVVRPSDYQGAASHYLKHVFEAFTPQETIRFFEEIGVPLVLEPTGKYFPTTHSGRTVLEALLKELERVRVPLRAGFKVSAVEKKEHDFELKGEDGAVLTARRVVLATGGLSYPETGSDGTGLRIAEGLGHALKPTCPALTPLTTEDAEWRSLSGVTVEAALSFFASGKKRAEARGSFLFTHFGFSGPAALDLSRHWAACGDADKRVEADFLPAHEESGVLKKIEGSSHSGRRAENFIAEEFSLPVRLAAVLAGKAGKNRRVLAHVLKHAPLDVSGVVGYKKAEATAGGVDLGDVRIATMGSKKVPGLFFAGEMLDVDGRIGGFNFQWAWSSGAVAGRGVMEGL